MKMKLKSEVERIKKREIKIWRQGENKLCEIKSFVSILLLCEFIKHFERADLHVLHKRKHFVILFFIVEILKHYVDYVWAKTT